MKLSIKTFCLTVLSLAFFASCSREIVPEGQEIPEAPLGPGIITVTINASNADASRTAIGEGNTSLWTVGDKLAIREAFNTENFVYSDGGSPQAHFVQWADSDPAASGGAEEIFTVQFNAFDNYPNYSALTSMEQIMEFASHPGKKFLYQAFYPAENAGEGSMSTIQMSMPPLQRPTATSFDPDADLLYSKPVYTTTQPTSLTLNFRRISALGIMKLKGIPEGISEDAVVETVQFISGIDGHQFDPQPVYAPRPKTRSDIDDVDLWSCPQLTGSVRTWCDNSINAYREEVFSFNDPGDLEWMTYYWMQDDVDYNTGYIVNLDYTGKDLHPNGLNAYFSCFPATFESGTCFTVKVTVIDDGKTKEYSRTVVLDGRSLEFTSGDATEFTVNMTSAEVVVFQPVTFSQGTLAYFQELNSPQPVIKFYNPNTGVYPSYPFDFTSDHEWEIDFTYDDYEDADWLEWGTIKKNVFGGSLSMTRVSDHERSATMVFTCLDNPELSFEIPVEEHFILKFRKDGDLIAPDEPLYLTINEQATITVEVQAPRWFDLDQSPYYWETLGDDISCTSEGASCIVALQADTRGQLNFELSYFDRVYDDPDWLNVTFPIFVKRNTADYISFSEETLAYFPELNPDHPDYPLIRVPFSSWVDVPIIYTSNNEKYEFEWTLKNDCYWLSQSEWNGIGYFYREDEGDPLNPRTSSIVFYSGSDLLFEIPVVEYEYDKALPSFSFTCGGVNAEYARYTIPLQGTLSFKAAADCEPDGLQFSNMYWTTDNGDRAISIGEPSSDNEVIVTGINFGGDYVNCVYRFDDIWFPEWWLYSYIDVHPIVMSVNGGSYYGLPLSLAPNQQCALTASIVGVDQPVDRVYWKVGGYVKWNYNTLSYEYYEGTSECLDLVVDSEDDYRATVTVRSNPQDDYESVFFFVILEGEENPYSFYYEVPIEIITQTSSSAPSKKQTRLKEIQQNKKTIHRKPSFGDK